MEYGSEKKGREGEERGGGNTSENRWEWNMGVEFRK